MTGGDSGARARLRRLAAAWTVTLVLGGCQMPGTVDEAAPVDEPAERRDNPAEREQASPGDNPTGEAPASDASGDSAVTTVTTLRARRTVTVAPAELNVREGETATYAVALGSRPSGAVTVAVSVGTATELTVATDTLSFTAANFSKAQTVTVAAAQDADAAADPPAEVKHRASGGGYSGAAEAVVTVTIVEDDTTTVAVASGYGGEHAGSVAFEVTLSLASDREVTVAYATGGAEDTATAGEDYVSREGTLTFAASSKTARTIEVAVNDDLLDEPDEVFRLTLSNANAPLAGGEETVTATGTIEDDDPLPELSIEDGSLTEGEGDGLLRLAVRLTPVSGRTVTVSYATADETATSGADYTSVDGVLTFAAGSTEQTIAVPITDDEDSESTETFLVTLGEPTAAVLSDAGATGTIVDDGDLPPLELTALAVTGGGTQYPAFESGVRHYGLTCGDATTLQVTAAASRNEAKLTLLRDNSVDNQEAIGTLQASVTVDEDHDVAIEVSHADDTATYVVHCVPASFPRVTILKKTDQVSDGLMLLNLLVKIDDVRMRYMTVMDNNGVPRVAKLVADSRNFQFHGNGPEIGGRTVRYSLGSRSGEGILLYDGNFDLIKSLYTVAPLTRTGTHDFTFNDSGNYLVMAHEPVTRDFSRFLDQEGNRLPKDYRASDARIQEVSLDGTRKFHWNGWDHLKLRPDCRFINKRDYSHLNSLQQLADGDIIASFRNCAKIVRIDRETGNIEWQLGGTAPARRSHTEFLEIVNDPSGEFCGQHHATLTESNTVVLFDNGVHCLGPRKNEYAFTRVVEYDISSGTAAVFRRHYVRPRKQGYSNAGGGVDVLDSGHWLISWTSPYLQGVRREEAVVVSEVDPATGRVHLSLNLMNLPDGLAESYRAYRESEADLMLPRNLP